MTTRTLDSFEASLRTATRLAPVRPLPVRVRGWLWTYFSTGSLSFERNFLFVRPAIAVVAAGAVLAQGRSLPGRDGVLVGCGVAILANFGMAVLVYRKQLALQRITSLIVDNGIVIGSALYFFMRMGSAGYETDMWLIFITLIVSNSLYYGPVGSAFFTTLWIVLFVAISSFYPGDSYFRTQLPTRLVFFVLTGFVGFSVSAELRKQREGLQQKTRQTLSMLATIVEARDTDAGMHLRHIQHYSLALALRLGIGNKEANEIAYAAMIHDVGKAQVPDAILKKPGPLTVEERREIEKHTLWGDALLAESAEFRAAREVARFHHERWDGAGYPDGLMGESIPLAARIVAVADVYDALISERPYKKAWRHEEAIAEIQRMSGSHLDPVVVEAFVSLYNTNVLRDMDLVMRDEPMTQDPREAA